MINNVKSLASKFKEEGFLSPVAVYSEQEIEYFQSSFKEFESHLSATREDYENLHFHANWARELATHPKLLDLIEAIIGPEILIYGTLVISKIPEKYAHLTWHQDQYFFPDKVMTPYITAWIALTDSTLENGCMKVIPGSHKDGLLLHLPFEEDDTNLVTKGVEVKINPKKDEIFNVVLKPSQISLHGGALVHSSFHNLTKDNRVGFIVRYVTPDISQSNNPILQVRGEKEIKHLALQNSLPFISSEEAAASYQKNSIVN